MFDARPLVHLRVVAHHLLLLIPTTGRIQMQFLLIRLVLHQPRRQRLAKSKLPTDKEIAKCANALSRPFVTPARLLKRLQTKLFLVLSGSLCGAKIP